MKVEMAQAAPDSAKKQMPPPDLTILDFQKRVGCDERALEGLQKLPRGDQLVAMDIVEKQQLKIKNPSAVTWSAVMLCQKEPARARMEYLGRNLDERATAAFGQLPPPVQEGICHEMDLAKVRNLSAFIFSKIRTVANNPGYSLVNLTAKGFGKGSAPAPAVGTRACAEAMLTMCRDRSRSPMGMSMVEQSANSFIQQNGLDLFAAESLRQCPPVVMQAVMQAGGLQDCRNPSAVVLARIKVARVKAQVQGGGGGNQMQQMQPQMQGGQGDMANMMQGMMGMMQQMQPQMQGMMGGPTLLDAFRMQYPIDDGAARALQALSPEDQFIACTLVDKQKPRNPSAVTWSIVKLVTEKPTQAKLEYLKHIIDEDAASALDRLGPDELEQVFAKANLARIRNPSAFVWSRVKALAGGTAAEGGGGGDMEQAMEQAMRPAKTAKASQTAKAGQTAIAPPAKQRRPPLRAAVAEEIPENDESGLGLVLESVAAMGITLDKRCQAKLAELSLEEQMDILSSVDGTVRNVSAYVWSKIRSMGKT